MRSGIRPRGGPFIPITEITLRASRSSGPGGQHANVTASRIEAVFEVSRSFVLSETQKARITAISQDARSQTRNRDLALERLEGKLAAALAVPRRRRATRPTRASKQKRLDSKRRQSEKKRDRRRPRSDPD